MWLNPHSCICHVNIRSHNHISNIYQRIRDRYKIASWPRAVIKRWYMRYCYMFEIRGHDMIMSPRHLLIVWYDYSNGCFSDVWDSRLWKRIDVMDEEVKCNNCMMRHNPNTRQLPKTWPLHQSSQGLVSKPHRRFLQYNLTSTINGHKTLN